MTQDLGVLGMREALLGASALMPSLSANDVEAVRQSREPARQIRLEFPATVDPERALLSPASARVDLPLLVAERARPPLANAAANEPELRHRRRKIRLFPRSAWLARQPDVGRYVDVSA